MEVKYKNQSFLSIPKTNKKRIVIIGGGFAGINLIKRLKGKDFQLILLDRNNYHTFQPLLYQVATAGLEPDSIAGPLRELLEGKKDFYFRMASVSSIDQKAKILKTDVGDLNYDQVIIATGSMSNFYGNKSVEQNAFPLKSIQDALNFRSHVLQNFEHAVIIDDQEELQKYMNIVIVGGGPTGVEVAGALGELKKHVLPKDYPELDLDKMNIYLVEGLDRLLNGMSEKSSKTSLESLSKFSVQVLLNKMVKSFDGSQVVFSDGDTIRTRTVVWAAGVKGCLPGGIPEASIMKGRIRVNRFNQVEGMDDVYAIGDIAFMQTGLYPEGHPMLAQVAIQQARKLASNLKYMERQKPLLPFEYKDKGSMATVGRNKAVADLPGPIHFGGLIAWMIWMFIHLISIIGFRNKLVIVSNWVWNYFTYDRGTRLIIRKFKPNWEPISMTETREKTF